MGNFRVAADASHHQPSSNATANSRKPARNWPLPSSMDGRCREGQKRERGELEISSIYQTLPLRCYLSQKHVSLSHSLLRGSIYQTFACPPSSPRPCFLEPQQKPDLNCGREGICNRKGLIKESEQGVLPPVKSVETPLLSFNYEDNETRQHLFRE